jgi:uncharacterized protein (TIGR03083 family)
VDFVETWVSAARAFADLVEHVPADRWAGPGLGEWTLRDLVGHTCSAGLRTVVTTLAHSVDTEDIPSPQEYYALATTVDPAVYAAAVAASTDDARRTGAELGDDPATPVRLLVADAVATVRGAVPDMLVASAGGGMRVSQWLPTRTFELAVHSLDVARAIGRPAGLSAQVIGDTAALAARIATVTGHGPDVVLALTGRGDLTRGFSVV